MNNKTAIIVDVPSKWNNFEICQTDSKTEKRTNFVFSKKNPNYEQQKLVFLKENPAYEKEFGRLL